MKLFSAFATTVVISGAVVSAAAPASAYETYRVTPTYNGGYRINGSDGYNGRFTPGYNGGGTYRDSGGGGFRVRPNYSGGSTYTFF